MGIVVPDLPPQTMLCPACLFKEDSCLYFRVPRANGVSGNRKARLVIRVIVSANAKIHMMVAMTNVDLMEG
jgi:hypothetical protein